MASSASVNYRLQRAAWRNAARRKFESEPWAMEVADLLEECLASIAHAGSGVNLQGVKDGPYYVGLMTSFIRTHFDVIDAARTSELTDGTTLIRKQLEIVARLRELDKIPSAKLIRKTPKIEHLISDFGPLYGEYSEIAHSSSTRYLELLGTDEADLGWTSLYPKFTPNAYVLLHGAGTLYCEFFLWLTGFRDERATHFLASQWPHIGQRSFELLKLLQQGPPGILSD
jgi:hypothetical protein